MQVSREFPDSYSTASSGPTAWVPGSGNHMVLCAPQQMGGTGMSHIYKSGKKDKKSLKAGFCKLGPGHQTQLCNPKSN